MRYGKLFLLDRGKIIICRNEAGQQVSFNSIEEFHRYYPGLDLAGKVYINYEPERKPISVYIDDSDPEITAKNVPEKKYEDVIAAVADLAAKKADPYFELDIAGAKALRIEEIKKEARAEIFEIWPIWKQVNCNAGIYGEDIKAEKNSDVAAVIAAVDAAEVQIESAKSVDDIQKIKRSAKG